MKQIILTTALVCTYGFASDMNATEAIHVKQEGIKYIKMLGGALKTELKSHMMADKTGIAAAGFCASKATSITKEINTKLPKYAKVRRTALKLRNDKENTADELDTKVMNDYVAAIEAKTFTPKDIKVVTLGNTTRVYKPLLTASVCLKCHGSSVSKEIKDLVHTTYPNDKAINFKEGSLRGVIVAEIEKH